MCCMCGSGRQPGQGAPPALENSTPTRGAGGVSGPGPANTGQRLESRRGLAWSSSNRGRWTTGVHKYPGMMIVVVVLRVRTTVAGLGVWWCCCLGCWLLVVACLGFGTVCACVDLLGLGRGVPVLLDRWMHSAGTVTGRRLGDVRYLFVRLLGRRMAPFSGGLSGSVRFGAVQLGRPTLPSS